jgi:hypothetical protein
VALLSRAATAWRQLRFSTTMSSGMDQKPLSDIEFVQVTVYS